MNLTLFSRQPKVFIDATVLCGALITDKINRQIIRLARTNLFYTPVLSKVCLLEFIRHAASGFKGGNPYSNYEIEVFLEYFINPVLEDNPAVKSVVGRYDFRAIMKEHLPIGQVLSELSGCSDDQAREIIKQQEMQEPLKKFDTNDLHVWVTAVQTNCDLILTSNSKRFPERIGKIKRIHPEDFYNSISD
ncbi:putative nucleic acid-binding protein [Desulfitispora alkaliphila]|uniref:PIN domain-containing protein n=1 Tax=Desulfitispora alkaliphila TaxID=622674 RepID=UPI003D1B67C9